MLQATTVVTPVRFEQGLRYADFLEQATVNRDKFELYYKESPLSAEDISFFKKAAALANGPAKILALAEAWCGDVYREFRLWRASLRRRGWTCACFFAMKTPTSWTNF